VYEVPSRNAWRVLVGVGVIVCTAPGWKSNTPTHAALCVSVCTNGAVFVAVCCSAAASKPSLPRHTHTPSPAWNTELESVKLTVAELVEPATAVYPAPKQIVPAVAVESARCVNDRPVAVTAPTTELFDSIPRMATITSPVCHDTDAVVFVAAPVFQTVSV
jgi:hypothetical protein